MASGDPESVRCARGIDSGHHMAEEAPDELARAVTAFLARPDVDTPTPLR